MNNFGTPDETPEHNALQAKFTDRNWVAKFIETIATTKGIQQMFERGRDQELNAERSTWNTFIGLLPRLESKTKELREAQARITAGKPEYYPHQCEKLALEITDLEAEIQTVRESRPVIKVSHIGFESKGADIEIKSISVGSFAPLPDYRIECKPAVGDDYPAILRQMRASQCNVLLIGEGGYAGTGATLEQVVAMFKSAGIKIVLLADV